MTSRGRASMTGVSVRGRSSSGGMKPCPPGSVSCVDMLDRTRNRFDPMMPAHRARTITLHTIQRARQARRELLLIVPLTALTILAYVMREQIFGVDTPVRVVAAV